MEPDCINPSISCLQRKNLFSFVLGPYISMLRAQSWLTPGLHAGISSWRCSGGNIRGAGDQTWLTVCKASTPAGLYYH